MSQRKFEMHVTRFYRHPFFTDYAANRYGRIFCISENRYKKTYDFGDYVRASLVHEHMPKFYEWDRFVYECRKNTRIPGCKVIHIDGNKLNNHIRNLDIEEYEEISDED